MIYMILMNVLTGIGLQAILISWIQATGIPMGLQTS